MSEAAAPRPRLLYVEDDAEIAQMTIEVLSETYDLAHESDGLAGRDRALRERFDVILLDRRLPRLDGAEIVRDLRAAHITLPCSCSPRSGPSRTASKDSTPERTTTC